MDVFCACANLLHKIRMYRNKKKHEDNCIFLNKYRLYFLLLASKLKNIINSIILSIILNYPICIVKILMRFRYTRIFVKTRKVCTKNIKH